MTAPPPNATQRRAATVGGIAYFVIIVTSILAVALGPSQLSMGGVVPASLQEIADHQLLYRVGAVYDLSMYAGVVLLSVALYRVLEPVGRTTALLGLLWRLGEAVFGCLTVVFTLAAVQLATHADLATGLGAELRLGLATVLLQATANSLTVLLVFLCLGTILNAYLFFASRYIPRWLSIWGMASCAVMLTGGVVKIISPDLASIPESIGAMTVIPFEIVIGLWLWLKGLQPAQ